MQAASQVEHRLLMSLDQLMVKIMKSDPFLYGSTSVKDRLREAKRKSKKHGRGTFCHASHGLLCVPVPTHIPNQLTLSPRPPSDPPCIAALQRVTVANQPRPLTLVCLPTKPDLRIARRCIRLQAAARYGVETCKTRDGQ